MLHGLTISNSRQIEKSSGQMVLTKKRAMLETLPFLTIRS